MQEGWTDVLKGTQWAELVRKYIVPVLDQGSFFYPISAPIQGWEQESSEG